MNTSHIENQICLKVVKEGVNKNNNFSFVFSLDKDNVYINSLSQEVSYGWEAIEATGLSVVGGKKSATELAFQSNKTNHSLTLKGVIYTQINKKAGEPVVAAGIKSLTNLKLQAGRGVRWHIIGENGVHYKGGGKGEWYIERIQQDSQHFITGLNALKIEFTISLKKYN